MSGHLQTAWLAFEGVQLQADAPAELRLLLRRAFFTGAYSHRELSRAVAELAPADAAVQGDSLRQELQVFAATVNTELEGKV